jgi:hypothetical protein
VQRINNPGHDPPRHVTPCLHCLARPCPAQLGRAALSHAIQIRAVPCLHCLAGPCSAEHCPDLTCYTPQIFACIAGHHTAAPSPTRPGIAVLSLACLAQPGRATLRHTRHCRSRPCLHRPDLNTTNNDIHQCAKPALPGPAVQIRAAPGQALPVTSRAKPALPCSARHRFDMHVNAEPAKPFLNWPNRSPQ